MRSAQDVHRLLAVGAPAPVTEVPDRPSRMIHFFDPALQQGFVIGGTAERLANADGVGRTTAASTQEG